MATSQKHYTGHKRDSHDSTDVVRQYGVQKIPTDANPLADLRNYIDHVYDQGELASCTANVVCAAYELVLKRGAELTGVPASNFRCSRLFVYYNSRQLQGNIGEDTGASLRNAFSAINSYGVCQESLWPYDVLKFAQEPSSASIGGAVGNTIVKFERLGQHMQQFRACLKDGFPFAFAFQVYDSLKSLENDASGVMPTPSDEEIQSTPEPDMQAGLAVGYDDSTERITVLNSWGASFGDKGYFYMPYSYISDSQRAFDFWTIVKVSEKGPSPKLNPKPSPKPGHPGPIPGMVWYRRLI